MLVRLIIRYAKPYWWHLLIVVIAQVIATLATLALPRLNADIIDHGIAAGDTGYIGSTGLVMLGVAGIQVVSEVVATFFAARATMGIGRDLRADVFDQVTELSVHQVQEFGPGTLMTRTTNDLTQVQSLALVVASTVLLSPIMLIGGLVMAMEQDVVLSAVIWAAVPVLLVFVWLLFARVMPLFRRMQDRIDAVNTVLREQIAGIRVVRAFVQEAKQAQRFDRANRELTEVSFGIGRWMVLMGPVIAMILQAAMVAVLFFGGHRVAAGEVQVGGVAALMQYLTLILMAVMMGVFVFMMIPRAAVAARRIQEVLTTEPELDSPHQQMAQPASAELVFDHVQVQLPGAEAPIVDEVSFRIPPGTTTAIIGSTGSGKTTLVKLMSRLIDPTAGVVRLGGVDLRELSRQTVSDLVGLAPQTATLFSGTVGSNLRFAAPQATDEQLREALEIAQCWDFLPQELAAALEYPVSQGGANLSGGQRQRLSIARALVGGRQIYVFDDALSALDASTEAAVRAGLARLQRDSGASVVMVAQRVSAITEADQILVIDQGRIVGIGTHAELSETNAVYRQIIDSQQVTS
ncbi:ABC transporter ATP-binding protein [Auritidibacter ignavus]|uniref:ABC transporter ATP-binding protein n=1 Tax=Auritidibacter ignavus TaxID=678932 RepID=A0AAJ6DFD6_9MICC|nr:ABC transporter ATP-binding protein [Auritidibacter ignavus]WGH94543.1 ABC transporter ATP-binding protein [Auritidibacter ignavus]